MTNSDMTIVNDQKKEDFDSPAAKLSSIHGRKWIQRLEDLSKRSNLLYQQNAPKKMREGSFNTLHANTNPAASERLIEVLAKIGQMPQGSKTEKIPTLKSHTHKPTIIQSYEQTEYPTLSKALMENQGFPWNEIKLLRCPYLMEQLVDVYQVGKLKGTKDDVESVISFCLDIAKIAAERCQPVNASCPNSQGIVQDVKLVIGKILYLMNQDPALVAKLLKDKERIKCLASIDEAFRQSLEKVCLRLDQFYEQHHRVPLQLPELALHNQLPVEIAKILLNNTGTINTGVIPILFDVFLKHKEPYLNHEINLSYTMKILERSPKMRGLFDKIVKPKSSEESSNDLIRIILKLPSSTNIEDLHAKQAALAGLLSHLRQGDDGTCFATYLAIEMLSSHLNLCLEDFADLLANGKLTRQVKGTKMDFPFLMKMGSEELKNEFEVDTNGKLREGYLWEAPGLIAAAEAMGIADIRKTIEEYIKDSSLISEASACKFSPKSIIRIWSSGDYSLYTKGCFAFEAQTHNALLKAWENAIAGMSEALESSMIKTAIRKSLLPLLESKIPENCPEELKIDLRMEFQRELLHRITLQYDPDCTHFMTQSDAKSAEGAFVLYDRSIKDKFGKWKRVDNANLFLEFVKDMLKNVKSRISKNLENAEDQKCLTEVNDILMNFIDSDKFLVKLVKRYHPANKELSVCNNVQCKTEFAPWATHTGNQSKAVLQVYLEQDFGLKTEEFLPMSAEQLLIKIIEMGKNNSLNEKSAYLENPFKMVPVITLDVHSFSLLLGHPSLRKAWQGQEPTQEWIKHFVLDPGKEIAQSLAPQELRLAVINCALTKVEKEKSNQKLRKLLSKISDNIPICKFRGAVLEALSTCEPNSSSKMDEWVLDIDSALVESLPKDLQKKLTDSAVYFADTNWGKGVNDILFCLVVNPGTELLELWESYSDGSHFHPINQKAWLFHHVWEFVKNSLL